ncbi:MAG TPA: PH domain-containing protein [Candidatus Saccharimonadales bacterium]|nr:PH domain-containing protein [Candidatus Saccharimonadales bacterium]
MAKKAEKAKNSPTKLSTKVQEGQDKQTKQKHFDDQFDDEDVLFVFRKHPVVMRKGLILFMGAILLGTVPALIKPEMSYFFGGLAGGFLLGLVLFFPSWIGWFYSVFIVTDQRLIQITQKGLFHRSVVDLNLNQIQMVNYQIGGFQETLLGFGTIMMQTYVGDLVIHNVHHPAKIQKKILTILRDQGVSAVSNPYNKEPDENEEETE